MEAKASSYSGAGPSTSLDPDNLRLQTQLARCLSAGIRQALGYAQVAEDSHPLEARPYCPKEFELCLGLLRIEGGHPSDVSTWVLEVGGQSIAHRLDHDCKNDGNGRGGLAGGPHSDGSDDSDDIDIEADYFGSKFGKATQLSLSYSKLEADVVPFNPPEITETLLEAFDRGCGTSDDNANVRDIMLLHGSEPRQSGSMRS